METGAGLAANERVVFLGWVFICASSDLPRPQYNGAEREYHAETLTQEDVCG
jgi:hypothetical protein